jgi:hypothetical protein
MRFRFLILCWCTLIGLVDQPNLYAQVNEIEIYNATDLINIGRNKGIHELEEKIQLIDLIYLSPSFATDIIDIEFKTGFWGKLHDNNNVYTFDIPQTTMELADQLNDKKTGAKLFEYYCKLPKFIKSDTIYYIYNHLDDYLKLLVKFKSPKLIERLKTDYYEWSILAKEAPRKIYPTIEERQKTSFEESLKFKQTDLYVDCNFLALQIAGALNSLKVVGFDNSLIEKLKTRQSWPYASSYSFPKTYNSGSKLNDNHTKTIQNRTSISNFRTDIKKIEKIFADNFDYCCDSRIYEIIENGNKAYISVSRSNGFDNYKVEIREDKTIKVEFIPGPIE